MSASLDIGPDFFDDRWEQDRLRHFFFLDTPPYRSLATASKHCVVQGHRGTGKTTLLKALHWRERLDNEYLTEALNHRPFSDHVLGCFVQLKTLPVDTIDTWLDEANSDLSHTIISAYLRCRWLIEACEALQTLNRRYEFAGLAVEIAALSEVAPQFWEWAPSERLGVPVEARSSELTVEDVRSTALLLAKRIRGAATRQTTSPATEVAELDLFSFNQLGNALFRGFAIYLSNFTNEKAWIFRICMDEREHLSSNWLRTIRTLMRECDSPLYLAISTLEPLGDETMRPGTHVSIDDRDIINLDERTTTEFTALLNGIVRARMIQRGFASERFNLQSFLGDIDFNVLFQKATSKSIKRSDNFRKYTRLNTDYLAERGRRPPSGQAQIGAIEHYLLQKGAILHSPDRDARTDRYERSTGYRKKKTAGYLSLLASLGLSSAFYAGWRVVMASADSSIRDFLRFLRAAYLRYCLDLGKEPDDSSLRAFLTQARLAPETQDEGLRASGERKMASLASRVTQPDRARRLVEMLGLVSHLIDFDPSANLHRPNAGTLVIQNPLDSERLVDLIQQCVNYGYLSDLAYAPETHRIEVRVNRSLARYYNFSHWKPQYSSIVPAALLDQAVRADSMSKVKPLAVQAVRTAREHSARAQTSTQLKIFDESHNNS